MRHRIRVVIECDTDAPTEQKAVRRALDIVARQGFRPISIKVGNGSWEQTDPPKLFGGA